MLVSGHTADREDAYACASEPAIPESTTPTVCTTSAYDCTTASSEKSVFSPDEFAVSERTRLISPTCVTEMTYPDSQTYTTPG